MGDFHRLVLLFYGARTRTSTPILPKIIRKTILWAASPPYGLNAILHNKRALLALGRVFLAEAVQKPLFAGLFKAEIFPSSHCQNPYLLALY